MERKLRILLMGACMIPSVSLCGDVQCRELERQGLIEYRFSTSNTVRKKDLRWADVVGLIRCDSHFEVYLAEQCRKAGKYMLYILDDDLLHVPEYLVSAAHYRHKGVKNRIGKIMSDCDCFVSPSLRLQELYGSQCRSHFSIVEPSTVQISEKRPHSDGKVHIGFAGSVDRGKDVENILADVLEEIAGKYGDRVQIELFGTETEFSRRLGITVHPYVDSYEAYQRKMGELNWDIGLAPMPDTPFHACKHYNKLVEYAGYGIAGVYSRVMPYLRAVRQEENGLLCKNEKADWVAALSRLIEDRELRERISRNCLKAAAEEYSVPTAAAEFLKDLESAYAKKEGTGDFPCFLFYKCLYAVLRRCKQILQRPAEDRKKH